MLTRVPFFKELVVGSFHCQHCNYKDSEINSAGRIQDKGVKIVLSVSSTDVSDASLFTFSSTTLYLSFPSHHIY